MQFDTIFPDSKNYTRTLYLLPAERRGESAFGEPLSEAIKLNLANEFNVKIVVPRFNNLPWYGNHVTDPKNQQETELKQRIIPYTEVTGNPEDRFLLGFSKSGWGAISLLLRDLDFFGGACSWDAPLMMNEENAKYGSLENYGTKEQMRDYCPYNLLNESNGSAINSKNKRICILGSGNFPKDTEYFHEDLQSMGVNHIYNNSLTFKHHWGSGWLKKSCEFLLK